MGEGQVRDGEGFSRIQHLTLTQSCTSTQPYPSAAPPLQYDSASSSPSIISAPAIWQCSYGLGEAHSHGSLAVELTPHMQSARPHRPHLSSLTFPPHFWATSLAASEGCRGSLLGDAGLPEPWMISINRCKSCDRGDAPVRSAARQNTTLRGAGFVGEGLMERVSEFSHTAAPRSCRDAGPCRGWGA